MDTIVTIKFKDWLIIDMNFNKRTASDVLSRLKRLNKIKNIDLKIDIDNYLHKVKKLQLFINLSPSIKSQLKRSLSLYYSFNEVNI